MQIRAQSSVTYLRLYYSDRYRDKRTKTLQVSDRSLSGAQAIIARFERESVRGAVVWGFYWFDRLHLVVGDESEALEFVNLLPAEIGPTSRYLIGKGPFTEEQVRQHPVWQKKGGLSRERLKAMETKTSKFAGFWLPRESSRFRTVRKGDVFLD